MLPKYTKSSLYTRKQFYDIINEYKLTEDEMYRMGYPIKRNLEDVDIVIYKQPSLNIHAKEFKPETKHILDAGASEFIPSIHANQTQFNSSTVIRTCVRCNKFFKTTESFYLTSDKCRYHWGKVGLFGTSYKVYSCCFEIEGSTGCSAAIYHVWNGVEPGVNGPYSGYVFTPIPQMIPEDEFYGIYAIDCEMSYTVAGLELTKVSVVDLNDNLVYDEFVRPKHPVVDYNTRFSGITEENLTNAKSLHEVQNDLLEFINRRTILIGHGLENDLRVLKVVHPNVVDTSHCFPHHAGFPQRRSLRNLISTYLNYQIQGAGHDSYEDAVACLRLMKWRVEEDYFKEEVSCHDVEATYRWIADQEYYENELECTIVQATDQCYPVQAC